MSISFPRLIASTAVVLTLASACGDAANTSTGADPNATTTTLQPTDPTVDTDPGTITGQITIRGADELSHLPEGTRVVVRVEDIAIQDASSVLLGQQTYDSVETLPLAYEVSWTPPTDPAAEISVSVSIYIDDDLTFTSDTVHPVTRAIDAVDVDVIHAAPDGPVFDDVASAASGIVGLTEEDATAAVAASGYETRVDERNGEQFALTEDHRENRINLVIVDDLVTETWIG